MYQARILDKDRKLKAVLPGVRWHYTRRINEATEISIYIPRETIDEVITPDHALYGFFAPSQPFVVDGAPRRERENKARYAEIAAFVQIYKVMFSRPGQNRGPTQVVTVTHDREICGYHTPNKQVWEVGAMRILKIMDATGESRPGAGSSIVGSTVSVCSWHCDEKGTEASIIGEHRTMFSKQETKLKRWIGLGRC